MKFILILFFVVVFFSCAAAQDKSDLAVASARAEKATTVLKQFIALGSDSVPFEIFRKAKAVAVFNNTTQINMLFDKITKAKGLLTIRNESGWSVPIFLDFASLGIELKLLGKKNFDVVFLFMDNKPIELLKKGKISPGKIAGKELALGPIVKGQGADLAIEKASVIYYTLENGQLSGVEFDNNSIFNSVGFAFDKNTNKAVYQKKGETILAENQVHTTVPVGIDIFRQTIINSLAEKP